MEWDIIKAGMSALFLGIFWVIREMKSDTKANKLAAETGIKLLSDDIKDVCISIQKVKEDYVSNNSLTNELKHLNIRLDTMETTILDKIGMLHKINSLRVERSKKSDM